MCKAPFKEAHLSERYSQACILISSGRSCMSPLWQSELPPPPYSKHISFLLSPKLWKQVFHLKFRHQRLPCYNRSPFSSLHNTRFPETVKRLVRGPSDCRRAVIDQYVLHRVTRRSNEPDLSAPCWLCVGAPQFTRQGIV